MYQGKNYHGGENCYAKTGIVDFPQGNSVFVCVVLRPRLKSMVMSGLESDALPTALRGPAVCVCVSVCVCARERERRGAHTIMSPVGNST